MEESTSKEKVLKNIRNALLNEAENPFPHVDFTSPVYPENEESPDVNFAEEFTRVGGKFVYCESVPEFVENYKILASRNNWPPAFCFDSQIIAMLQEGRIAFTSNEDEFLKQMVGITGCEFLISRLGSIMVSSRQGSGRKLNVFPEVHIVIAWTHQLVPDLRHAFAGIMNKYAKKIPSMISIITGPSRTADIEKTLVMGAHGPKELYVFMIEDSNG